MAENLNLELTAQAWANIVIEKWERKIIQLKVQDTSALINSFEAAVRLEANGSPKLIEFAFLYYGKFADMGAGKGVNAGAHEGTNRSPKPWYSRTFFSQLQVLAEIMADKYAQKGAMAIVENLAD